MRPTLPVLLKVLLFRLGIPSLGTAASSVADTTAPATEQPITPVPVSAPSAQMAVPYTTPNIFGFKPSKGVRKAGDYAAKVCSWLGSNFKSSKYDLELAFAQYYPEGSNPSLELLAQTYPPGTLPSRPSLKSLLAGVGPDFDLSADNYGKNRGRAASNGPLGGLPAFCRYGAFIKTSNLTRVLTEVWLPVASDASLSLAAINGTDYPTASTPIELDESGNYVKGPPYLLTQNTSARVPENCSSAASAMRKHSGPHKSRAYLTGEQVLGSSDGWNGRLLWMGNGGQRGALPMTDLKQVMARYRFAVAGSNTGHWSTSGDATWVNGSQYEETLKDWAGLSTHLGKHLAEEVINSFYGRKAKRSYYTGCSNGGKAGFESAMYYPGDFDGIMAGAPGIDFNHMNAGQIHTHKLHRKASVMDGWFSLQLLYGPIHQTILDQCDHLDGVEDGILVDPRKCEPNFADALLCGGIGKYSNDNTTCLSVMQLENLQELYRATIINGQFVYPAYPIGSESNADALSKGADKAGNWFDLVVRKSPNLVDNGNWSYWNNLTYDIVQKGDREGSVWSATTTDLSKALKKTKIITYHGLSDLTISPYSTENFLKSVTCAVRGKLPKGTDFEDVLRFYEVPGMNHCRNGASAWHFGGVTQNDAGNRPYRFTTRFDLLLSLVAWVEMGFVSPYQVAAEYESRSKIIPADPSSDDSSLAVDPMDELPTVYQSYNFGLKRTRKLCAWPKRAVYDGKGNTMGPRAFESFRCL